MLGGLDAPDPHARQEKAAGERGDARADGGEADVGEGEGRHPGDEHAGHAATIPEPARGHARPGGCGVVGDVEEKGELSGRVLAIR